MPSLADTFRTLAAFEPSRADLTDAPWDEYVDWAIAQGLAPLAAYNLEYRLGGAGAPEWARDRLLSVYQGSLNDNVMKLVNFKRALDALEGRRIVVLGGASFAESLYPHVAFRPVVDLRLLVRPRDLDGLAGWLARADFRPDRSATDPAGAARILSDGRTQLLLHAGLLGDAALDEALVSRAIPMRVYGPSVFRLELEDALLALCLEHARFGYDVPTLSFVDLRELLLGAPMLAGPYSRPFDPAVLHARAREWRIGRALYASTAIASRLFPELSDAAARAAPKLRAATRTLLDRLVVDPASTIGRSRSMRGSDRLRRLLAGGR